MLITIMIKYPVSSLFCEGRSSSNVNYLIVIFYEKKYDLQFNVKSFEAFTLRPRLKQHFNNREFE